MTTYQDEDPRPMRKGRAGLVIMLLAGFVFVGSVVIKPAQPEPTDVVAAAAAPMVEAVQAPAGETTVPEQAGDIAAAAVEGAGDAAREASPIDWAMIGSAVTFLIGAIGALAGVFFGWRNDRREERLAELHAREIEMEINRLRSLQAA
jgi:hypothetical protein